MASIYQRLTNYNNGLIPEMVQLKYKLMLENAFRFFRGTCHLFYEDLSKAKDFPDGPASWICGDLHLENFGSYKGDNRMVYFDLNDFDESILAPLTWEVVRVLTSIFVAFDTLNISPAEAKKAARLFLDTYTTTLSGGKAYYIDPRTAKGLIKDFMKTVKKRKEGDLIRHVCQGKAAALKIAIDNKTHFNIDPTLKESLKLKIAGWIEHVPEWPNHYEIKDIAFRVAGTGSVGLKRYMFLLQSNNNKHKYLIVEMKQTRPSCLSPYVTVKQPEWKSEAERLISLKRRMQNIPPALLSEIEFEGESYIFQEMQPLADKINFELIENNYKDIESVIRSMAVLTASAQIRSSGRQGSAITDELIAFAKRNDWQPKLLEYAAGYLQQVEKDYDQFTADYKDGKFALA
ncbi:DUF2252 domain-containing protein [Mucilaginibacter sp. KACC 22063]|uniref:DUF2252 domain-containing protein n=1 Tax=Mucilaginibacter sp. KACC 22063 TaxID=3025666 RepID=UPI002366484D|nr:DUF2252 family protein [Mucilaginibacter sp. KACC 22063]WDF56944.1 DUF2252 family protein [Mucilaginibacter sp. KACC 22063]